MFNLFANIWNFYCCLGVIKEKNVSLQTIMLTLTLI